MIWVNDIYYLTVIFTPDITSINNNKLTIKFFNKHIILMSGYLSK